MSHEEAVVWWGEKRRVDRTAIAWTAAVGLILLAFGLLFAPEMLSQPLESWWKAAAAPLLPAASVALRERLAFGAVAVSDRSIAGWSAKGDEHVRLSIRAIAKIRRDWITGGVLLEGRGGRIHVPSQLSQDAREALRSQMPRIRGSEHTVDDRLGWLKDKS